MKFRELKLRRNPNCPVCGTNPSIKKLIDYDEFCGIPSAAETVAPDAPLVNGIPQISVTDYKQQLDAGKEPFLLDVREPHEHKIANLGGYLIPLGDLEKRLGEVDSSREIIVQCRSGARSQKAAEILRKAGFQNVKNLAGGILAWSDKVDPSVPKY
jgi:adenylyltransferase/sulfurtransferase